MTQMKSRKRIVIFGGGTVSHIRNHLALCAPAYGGTARRLAKIYAAELESQGLASDYVVETLLTKMADSSSKLETNADVAAKVDELLADPTVKSIIFNVAMADFDGQIGDIPSGKTAKRLRTNEGAKSISISPSDKVIGRIRKTRKDIFLVGFKTTCGESADVQYKRGIELLKVNSANLVLANDTASMLNMICAPEETRYAQTENREDCLAFLAKMAISRMQNTFTRSTVVEAPTVSWTSDTVPANLREVVDHCIERGAYKPILGKTAGHFAVKVGDGEILTSIRKSNFNDLGKVGLVKVESSGDHEVIAYGAKPSVGGQSQRIIFKEHEAEGLDCIVHFHCPVRADAPLKAQIPVKAQWPNECGSHECGRNTSRGLAPVDLGGGDKLSVVFLDEHGPNIVFNRNTPAFKVKAFIDGNFDLSAKTGGLVAN